MHISSKNDILVRIQHTAQAPGEVPDFPLHQGEQFTDPIKKFCDITLAVGAQFHLLSQDEKVDEVITQYFPNAQNIASSIALPCVNRSLEKETDPHHLADIDVAIIEGVLGVAENASIFINQTEKYRVAYFITQSLVILLDRTQIVHNSHEANQQIVIGDKGFGIFISGPSKTADIEQSLVIGAHGPKEVLVILK